MSAFSDLPTRALTHLADALENKRLSSPFSKALLKHYIPSDCLSAVAEELSELEARKMSLEQIAWVVRLLAQERKATEQTTKQPELVWSGLKTKQVSFRDTKVVVQSLFNNFQRKITLVSYALDRGKKAKEIFKNLAERMEKEPQLRVRLIVNIHPESFNHEYSNKEVEAFIKKFQGEIWPGKRFPEVYHDPRSLENSKGNRACLHAKCIIADKKQVFISSANFTEAAHQRNLELGVLLENSLLASDLENQFETLIEQKSLQKLPFP